MSTRISYRKGGEEKFKEITDKPQFMYLDNITPPEAEEPLNMSEELGVIREMKTQRFVDGDKTPRNSDEKLD